MDTKQLENIISKCIIYSELMQNEYIKMKKDNKLKEFAKFLFQKSRRKTQKIFLMIFTNCHRNKQ